MSYELLKWIHILSATLLFGTGLGSAFYKWMADRSGDVYAIAQTNRTVVLADWLFTTPMAFVQPITGVMLVNLLGFPWLSPWLVATYVLYAIAGICWLPVVWLQIKMQKLSDKAVTDGTALTEEYHRLARYWFWLGVPAFLAFVAIFFLMVFKRLG